MTPSEQIKSLHILIEFLFHYSVDLGIIDENLNRQDCHSLEVWEEDMNRELPLRLYSADSD